MCGIFGMVGDANTTKLLMQGLKRMEYRGYDSSGICIVDNNEFIRRRAVGELSNLEPLVVNLPDSECGIAHTRWATHGPPTEDNAHPHMSPKLDVAVVHNGIIENEVELRKELSSIDKNITFKSDTDSEIIAHLFSNEIKNSGLDLKKSKDEEFISCWKKVIDKLEGSFALAVILKGRNDFILFARKFAPLVISHDGNKGILASDVSCIVGLTDKVHYLEEGDWGLINKNGIKIFNADGDLVEKEPKKLEWTLGDAELGGYPTFMLKEIYEQPRVVRDCLRGRLSREKIKGVSIPFNPRLLRIVGCGTAYNAGLLARYYIEQLSKIPVILDHAHEFRYGAPSGPKSLVIGISQSGETADTLAAIQAAHERGYPTLGIVNVESSTIARNVDTMIGIRAGPEIGVASTKAFTGQVLGGLLVAMKLGQDSKNFHREDLSYFDRHARMLPTSMERMLNDQNIKTKLWEAQQYFVDKNHAFFLGRNTSYPIALEGALKLKEISYIHAEGYAGGELKHGPLALVEEGTPIVVIASEGSSHKKLLGNAREVAARGAKVILITHQEDELADSHADLVIKVPRTHDLLQPLLYNIICQLLSLNIAEERGCNVDRPRNLAKSVTVE
ncbi:MAG: glutamine--fructose-6-phosphate transaminase (isomerizing) [Candidatus Thermoplasmatota archaeon]|nr:glutamine--fructose-6-phosphate transaminase (isomerizing) [Candidatus Thermoplasmatota archaeon]